MGRWLAATLAAAALLAACTDAGQDAGEAPTTAATSAPAPRTTEAPESGERRATTDTETMERVVRDWSTLLNAGDNRGVARLFALPAVIAQGEFAGEFRSYDAIADFYARLPCSGTVVSISFDEPDVALAVFSLGHRTTSRCDAEPGTLAAARFVFRDGELVAWQQVPVPADEDTAPVV